MSTLKGGIDKMAFYTLKGEKDKEAFYTLRGGLRFPP